MWTHRLIVPKDIYGDLHREAITNVGFQVENEGDKVLEDRLQKYEEYKVGSMGNMEFSEDRDWY